MSESILLTVATNAQPHNRATAQPHNRANARALISHGNNYVCVRVRVRQDGAQTAPGTSSSFHR